MLLRPYFVYSFLATAALASPYKRTDPTRTSAHWAGIMSVAGEKDTFTDISSTFYTPTIKGPFNSDASFAIVAGLDNESCPNGYMRIGVDVLPNKHHKPYYQAWAVWHPRGQRKNFDMSISAGHQIQVTIARLLGSVFAVVKNLSTNQTESVVLSHQAGYTICGRDAMTVLVPYHPQVPIANFGEIIFTDGSAISDVRGFTEQHSRRIRLNLEQNGKITARTLQDHPYIEYVG